ncbi:hypothetical protein PGB90_008219 [Kerria lacca]
MRANWATSSLWLLGPAKCAGSWRKKKIKKIKKNIDPHFNVKRSYFYNKRKLTLF